MHIASGTLILVADGAKMLLFRNDGNAINPLLNTLEHRETANLASHERGTDTPGRTFASIGARRSAYSETDWRQQAEDRFAADALERLAATAAECKAGVIIIAPPRTLGELRKHYGSVLKDRLLAEIGKDLTGHDSSTIIETIAAHGP